ncbi:hypothetical protein GUJ93_ZPchr0014g47348 [Zizania palustris]|uniref:Uncharacterized protein n=1 Tax=Zizania palustris TaxID=103762 RepID=A0A8J5TAQ5_ZIZPA|nr:hypothetical protein GUJ93_ZPchr0014g47348 [Zizania palustris]
MKPREVESGAGDKAAETWCVARWRKVGGNRGWFWKTGPPARRRRNFCLMLFPVAMAHGADGGRWAVGSAMENDYGGHRA